MSTTDTTVWDYVVTYGGPSLFMTAVFVVVMPLVWFKFARPRFRRWPTRLAVMLTVWIAAWLIAYGDVLMIAREAKRVCEAEAGLRVYRTVEVEGFAGVREIDYWSERGFKFVEYRNSDESILRFYAGREPEKVQSPRKMRSDVEYEYLGWIKKDEKKRFHPNKRIIRDLKNGEILGEVVSFSMQYGWLDAPFASATGASRSVCEGSIPIKIDEIKLDHRALINAVIKPVQE